jgi:hypothetical protein
MIEPMAWGDGELHFGDPIPCEYRWLHPQKIDDYAGDLRAVGRKVGQARDSFEFLDRLPPPPPTIPPIRYVHQVDSSLPPATTSTGESEGLALEAMRERGNTLNTRFAELRADIRGVAGAMEDYATALRTYRDQLAELQDYAIRRELKVTNGRILAPLQMMHPQAPQREINAWEDAWRSYAACFEWVRDIRKDRRAALSALRQAMLEHAGVRPEEAERRKPDPDRTGSGGASFGDGKVRKLRREAADAAHAAIVARQEADQAQGDLRRARIAADNAHAELSRLKNSGADAATIAAQEMKVFAADQEVRDAEGEARDKSAKADELGREAQRAAAAHQEAKDRRDGRSGFNTTPA